MPKTIKTPVREYPLVYADMLKQTHLLIAGETGSGKSCLLTGLIRLMLLSMPIEYEGGGENAKQLILIDPKGIDFLIYADLPHTLAYASEGPEIVKALQQAVNIMERRYREVAARSRAEHKRYSNYWGGHIYVIIDEYADLITTNKKETQPLIQRLAQKGRAANIHVILATQCPKADVIDTKIKCNFPSRVGLRVGSRQDSRNILDNIEQNDACYYLPDPVLEGRAECVFVSHAAPIRIAMPLYSDEELESLVKFWMDQNIPCQTLAAM